MKGASAFLISAVLGAVGLLLAVFIVTGLLSWDAPEVDEYGLHYSGGPFEGKKFEQLIPPGSSGQFLGPLDKLVRLPSNQRTYIVSQGGADGERAGGDVITVTDRQGVELQFETSSSFDLSSKPDVLNKFYEEVCTKYDDCYDEEGTNADGWGMMLNDYYRKAQESALQTVARGYTTDQLMKEDLGGFQREVAVATEKKVAENMGGAFFEDITFQIQRPIAPPSVQDRYNAAKAAELQTQVRKEEVAQAEQQALAAEELAQTLNDNPNYLELQKVEALNAAVENGKTEFWVLPNDTTMPAPAR